METSSKLRIKLNEYGRVLRVTRKPDMDEFKTILKVSALGTLIIGAIGFLVRMLADLVK